MGFRNLYKKMDLLNLDPNNLLSSLGKGSAWRQFCCHCHLWRLSIDTVIKCCRQLSLIGFLSCRTVIEENMRV